MNEKIEQPNPQPSSGDSTCMLHGALSRLPADETLELGKNGAIGLPNGGEAKDRYVVDCEIARGGMGAILRARDRDIRRDVALKVVLGETDSISRQRFVMEAQITGQLEHPNIVPIHDIGTDSRGQVYFTMKLVHGRSLAEVLKALRKRAAKTRGADDAEFPLRRLLGIFTHVCNAIAFAHSKGVVHRDLKPANIMIGDFGEVLVMDWGLAKVVPVTSGGVDADEVTARGNAPTPSNAQAGAAATSSESRHIDTDAAATVDGVVLGTLMYMAPEQTTGRAGSIDARTDIYALGAILYELLTLKTALDAGGGTASIMAQAASGKRVRPEVRAPERAKWIPKELSAITMKAMAVSRKARYQRAEELRRDIESFLQGRTVSAKPDSPLEMTVKLIRRNKPVFGALSAAALVLLAFGAFSVQRILEKTRIAEEQLAQRLALEQEKQAALDATGRAAAEAVQRGRHALAAAQNLPPSDRDRENALIDAQADFRKSLYLKASDAAAQGMREASLAHFAMALANHNWRQAREKLEQARQIDLSNDIYETKKRELTDAESARGKRIRERVRTLMEDAAKTLREIPHELARQELVALNDPLTVELLLGYLRAQAGPDASVDPRCIFLAIDALAWLGDSHAAEAIEPYVRPVTNGVGNPIYVQEAAVMAICLLMPEKEQIYEAVRARIWVEPENLNSLIFQKSRHYFERYSAKMSGLVKSQRSERGEMQSVAEWFEQGVRYLESNKPADAVACFTRALEADPRNTGALMNRGSAKCTAGDLEGGIADFDAALAIDSNLPRALANRGRARELKQEFNAALKDYDAALALLPGDATAHCNRGNTKAALADYRGALADYDAALELNPNFAAVYANRGCVRDKMDNLEGAIADYNKALEMNPADPRSFVNRGVIQQRKQQYDAAIADYDKALEVDPRFAAAYANRASAKLERRDFEGAIADYTKTLELDSNNEHACGSLALIRLTCPIDSLRDYKAALPFARRAADVSATASNLDTLALALFLNGSIAEAIATEDKARALLPAGTPASERLHFDEALTRFKAALK